VKGIGSLLSKAWNKVPQFYKGVSAGGEEFTSKLDKDLKGKARPDFIHGTL
jgi:hypothetical protein